MIKYFCDCCEREVKHLNKFSFLCHLSPEGRNLCNGYEDNEGNPVSGREDSIALCNRCYNEIVSQAIAAFVIRKNQKEKTNGI